MTAYAVVDSGTTATRLRLWRDGRVAWTARGDAGARDTAIDGAPVKIRAALRELLERLTAETGIVPDAVVCSGMITSNLGLHEVPHLPAPASIADLARGIVHVDDHDLGITLSFVPGVKTNTGEGIQGLADGDVLRGEEVEVVGLRARLGLRDRPATFLHFGSHHKAIDVDVDGRILGSRSAITGELLAAVSGYTVLKDGLTPLDDLTLDPEAVLAGAHAARVHGFGRAAFLVRVGRIVAGHSSERMTNFFVGALAALDLPLVEHGAIEGPVVLYGRGAFPEAVATVIAAGGGTREVLRVDDDVADLAAAEGAVQLYELAQLPASA